MYLFFFVLKFFNIQIKEDRMVSFMDVIWQVSSANWLKVNIDGATKGCPSLASCIDTFKGSQSEYVDIFSTF